MGGGEVCGCSSESIPGFPCDCVFCCAYRHVVVESVKLLSWIDRRNAIHITVARVDFTLKAPEPLILPPYKGSTLRGGFGAAFRRIVCVIREFYGPPCLKLLPARIDFARPSRYQVLQSVMIAGIGGV